MTAIDHDQIKPGFTYPDIDLCISAALQAEKLHCCNIDPARYGPFVDLTQFCNESILAATKSGISINGNVHTTERVICNQRIALDQPLVMSGTVIAIEQVPRGALITSEFTYTLPDGTVPLRTRRSSIRLEPEPNPALLAKRPQPVEPELSDYETVGVCQLDPENVTRYSSEGGNAIHYDPATAARFGFRAPIAGGLMGVRALMATLCLADGPPNLLDISIRFRRPMFWDERLEIMQRSDTRGRVRNLALVNSAGKTNVEAAVAQLA